MPELLDHADLHLALDQRQPDRLFPDTCPILGVQVCATTLQQTADLVHHWVATSQRPRLVTFTNVHMLVEANVRPEFREILEGMDLNCPDGAPVYWLLKLQEQTAEKISGPDFMPLFCEQSVALGHRHFLYGGAEGVPDQAAEVLRSRYPGINIVGQHAPPFRTLTEEEADAMVDRINSSNPDVVWVSLGCPRQETWLHKYGPRLNAKVVFAVGQATDIIAGTRSRCPSMMSGLGLEWLYRLTRDPRRLWKRYLVTNSLFCLLLLRSKLSRQANA